MEDKIKVFIFDYDETLYYNVDWTFFLNRNYQFLINHLKTLNLNDNQIENLLKKHDCFNQPGKLSVAPILIEVEGSCKAWVEFNEKQPPDFARLHNSIAVPNSELAKFAKKVWGVDGAYYDAYQAAEEGIFRFKNFLRSIGMPTSFKDAGIGTDKIDAMVAEVIKFGSVGHYIELKSEDVRKIYDIASSL